MLLKRNTVHKLQRSFFLPVKEVETFRKEEDDIRLKGLVGSCLLQPPD